MKDMILTMNKFKDALKKKEVVIFCAGEYCMRFLNRLEDEELSRIRFLVDNNEERQGTTLFGIPVESPSMISSLNPSNTLVVIADENHILEIYKQIREIGPYNVLSAYVLLNDSASQVAQELLEGQKNIEQVTDYLYDEVSKYIYNETIRRRMLYGKCDFSDLIMMGDAEYRIPLLYSSRRPSNEILIDCGAYDGDTLKKFFETYGPRLKKIYAFECMEESAKALKMTIDHLKNKKLDSEMIFMPYALSDHEGIMKLAQTEKPKGSFLLDGRTGNRTDFAENYYVDVNVTALDKVIPEDEMITFIKMDIEGSEFAALHGAKRIITVCKPRLAISIYHSGEDYYRIPLYLKSLVPEYRFAVRHHNAKQFDTDLYCWIEE